MQEHDEVCVCFHVPVQKIRKFIRLNHPKIPSQLSECYGAGTGCGWCIPYLERIFEAETEGSPVDLEMSREEYLARRLAYQSERPEENKS